MVEIDSITFFPELYNLYGPFFKGTYVADLVTPLVKPEIIIYLSL